MNSDDFIVAEDFFTAVWDTEELDRDLSGSSLAKDIYNDSQINDLTHFVVPMGTHESKGEPTEPVFSQSIPLEIFAEKYRDILEDIEIKPQMRLDNAIEMALEMGNEADADILQYTKAELGARGKIDIK